MQAEIGQNRSIFPIRSKLPRIIGNDDLTGPARLVRAMRDNSRLWMCRKTLATRFADHYGHAPRAKSVVGQFGRLPPASRLRSAPIRLRTVPGKTAHPKDSFDKTDQRTLETFNSRAGKAGCIASVRRSGNTECSA